MAEYSPRARERAMKREEVMLRVISKQLTFWQAARILRLSARHLRRIATASDLLKVLEGEQKPQLQTGHFICSDPKTF